jgi:DNA-binding CsgD family transcriptional regulator
MRNRFHRGVELEQLTKGARSMLETHSLRPLERRILRLVDEGLDQVDIARRFRRSPEFVGRIIDYTRLPRGDGMPGVEGLRPLERRVLKWRASGASHTEIGRRFHRSAGHVERVEQLARYKLQII